MTPSSSNTSRDGGDDEGVKAAKSVKKEIITGVKESEQCSLFKQPTTRDDSVKDTVNKLIESKDYEIKSYKDILAQKDIIIATKDAAIANKDKEINALNEKVQTLESTMSKKNGECREVIDVIHNFKKRATATRNWTEFNRFIEAISLLQFSVNFT